MNDQQRFVVKRLSDDSPIRRLALTCMIDDTQLETVIGFFYDRDIAGIAVQALNELEQQRPIKRVALPD